MFRLEQEQIIKRCKVCAPLSLFAHQTLQGLCAPLFTCSSNAARFVHPSLYFLLAHQTMQGLCTPLFICSSNAARFVHPSLYCKVCAPLSLFALNARFVRPSLCLLIKRCKVCAPLSLFAHQTLQGLCAPLFVCSEFIIKIQKMSNIYYFIPKLLPFLSFYWYILLKLHTPSLRRIK